MIGTNTNASSQGYVALITNSTEMIDSMHKIGGQNLLFILTPIVTNLTGGAF